MATNNLATLLTQIERQYRPKWQYAAPDELATRIHDAGTPAETAVTVLSRALIGGSITFPEWDSATTEVLKRIGLLALVIGIGGLLLQAATRKTPEEAATRKTPEEAFAALQADYNARAAGLAKALATGRITIDEWQQSMSEQLRRYHLGAALAGSTDRKQAAGIGMENARLQQTFLDQFTADIRSGKLPIDAEARIRQRAQLYGGAGRATFFEAQAAAIGVQLPFYPADGGTLCLSNCKCSYSYNIIDDVGSVDAYYSLAVSEHCQTCLERHAVAYPIQIRNGRVITPIPAHLITNGVFSP